jgi:hypothetical protein
LRSDQIRDDRAAGLTARAPFYEVVVDQAFRRLLDHSAEVVDTGLRAAEKL